MVELMSMRFYCIVRNFNLCSFNSVPIHLPQREKIDFAFIANAVCISSPYATSPLINATSVSFRRKLVAL